MALISCRALTSFLKKSKYSTIEISRNEQLLTLPISYACKTFNDPFTFQIRNYAARKGTRERKAKRIIKKEEVKVGFIPHNLRNKEKMLAMRASRKFDDSWKRQPIDDVFSTKYYQSIIYPFQEAVKCHQETHHPSMYNVPNSPLQIVIELNMQAEKKNRFVDNFSRIVAIPHKFDHGEERSIIVFSKDRSALEEAQNAGASLTGGIDLIKQIQNGVTTLQDFQFVIAHPDILPELVSLRGLMKRKFPNPKSGTLDVDVGSVVTRFLHGVSYTAKKDEHEKDFGIIEATIGDLTMQPKELEENFAALIKDVYSMKPKRDGDFVTRCLLVSPPSNERLKVDHNQYIGQQKRPEDQEDDDDLGERVAL